MKKTILITGTSSGIGKAAAKVFAGSGWNVVATMRSPEKETELGGLSDVLVTRLDVADRDSIAGAIEAGIARFGRIDALVNNAGYSVFGVFEAISREKMRAQFDVNIFGVMEVTRAILPHFRQNKGGLIMNVSSRGGIVGLPLNSLYCASKFAVEGFSESLAYELATQNIVVKIIEPSGGTSGTNFSKRMKQEYAKDTSITDYDGFVSSTNAIFEGMRAGRMTSAEQVARVIFDAAMDGTRRLRYIVGNDNPPFIQARREMSDQDYIEFMRSRFLPRA